MREFYLDNASTTRLSTEALHEILPFLGVKYGNPSSLHQLGSETRTAIEQARKTIAKCINAKPNEIYFTSGGSESDNWAIQGIVKSLKGKGKNHIITSAFEHHAVLHTCETLKKEGFEITLLDVHEDGIVRPEELEQAITDKTALVSIMFANNEIGTIQPIRELGRICRKYNVPFHTDAVQALGNTKIDVYYQFIDLLSMSAHKVHGLKGCGALYIRNGINIEPLIYGGGQEQGKRAGTENVVGIVSFAHALKQKTEEYLNQNLRKIATRDKFIKKLLTIPDSQINGSIGNRLSGNINISFKGIEGESLLLRLNRKGIYVSAGSACNSGSLKPSHVLTAIGVPDNIAKGTIRITFDEELSDDDIDYITDIISNEVNFLRSIC